MTNIVNTVMRRPEWDWAAIFATWEDRGRFCDQVVPPDVDALGYGIRVAGLVVNPYAKTGCVDHQTLSFDSYLMVVEDDFLSGTGLHPTTDGRPGPGRRCARTRRSSATWSTTSTSSKRPDPR